MEEVYGRKESGLGKNESLDKLNERRKVGTKDVQLRPHPDILISRTEFPDAMSQQPHEKHHFEIKDAFVRERVRGSSRGERCGEG